MLLLIVIPLRHPLLVKEGSCEIEEKHQRSYLEPLFDLSVDSL